MDIYGNKRQKWIFTETNVKNGYLRKQRQLFIIALNGFATSYNTVCKIQQKLTNTDDTMSGALDMRNNRITGIANPTISQRCLHKKL